MSKIVALIGSPSPHSRTKGVIDSVLAQIAEKAGTRATTIQIGNLLSDLAVLSRDDASDQVRAALRAVEESDLLIVGTPVYKGSYPGLFKHFIDLLDYKALTGLPVGLVATGGSDRHALVVEHQLRPLFGFFNAQTLPTGVFIRDNVIVDGDVRDELVAARLNQLTHEAILALTATPAPYARHVA